MAQPHKGAMQQHCKNSALPYFNNSRILVPILRCLEESFFYFSSSHSYLPFRAHLSPLPLATWCWSYTKGGWRRKKIPVPLVPSILSLPVNRHGFKSSEYAFPNANTFTGHFECNRLKIKSKVWNGTANLNLLLLEHCMAAWMTDFF